MLKDMAEKIDREYNEERPDFYKIADWAWMLADMVLNKTSNPYADAMKGVGLVIDASSDESATYANGDGLKFRALHYDEPDKSFYELHIAMNKNFDRWSNSVDFIAPLPQSIPHMKKILAAIDAKIKAGCYGDGYGERYRLEI